MGTIIAEFIRSSGPLAGPMMFGLAVVITWAYHSMQRRTVIQVNRVVLLLVDKNVCTMREAKEYGLLGDVGDVYGVMQGVV